MTRSTTRAIPARPFWMIASLSWLLLAATALMAEGKIIKSHGYSFYGDLTYPADFPHFNYVNPDAPKGGTISTVRVGTFDSMNPFTRKGRGGAYSSAIYESLLGSGWNGVGLPADTLGEGYGLLAESLEYDEGKTWVIFHMRPEARFSDGTPLTAHDVAFSHNLFLEQGLPSYAQAVSKRIPKVEVIDDHTIKFYFATDLESRRTLIDQVGGTPVFSQKWYEETGHRLDEPRMEISPGSGPYVLDSFEANRYISYRRNPDYWGKDLPINIGRSNFDEIRVEYFADSAAAFEGFKAGEYLFRSETSAKRWASGYNFPALENGDVVQETIADDTPPNAIGFVFNLGKPKFQDVRVRQAIAYAYNFEWVNESLEFGLFSQRHSFVQNAPHEANGAPEGLELEMLQALGDLVPAEMLTQPARMAHASRAGRSQDRRNMRAANQLLDDAGWVSGDDGLRRKDGEVLSITLPFTTSWDETRMAIHEHFVDNLKAMGIDAAVERIDPAQFTSRRRDRNYDMVYWVYGTFMEPGTGLQQRFGSAEAELSLFNPAGLASPLVDAIITKALSSNSKAEETASLMALDRALRHEFIMVPVSYNPNAWVAYWDMYDHPENLPPYDLGILDFWWTNPEKEAALKASGALR